MSKRRTAGKGRPAETTTAAVGWIRYRRQRRPSTAATPWSRAACSRSCSTRQALEKARVSGPPTPRLIHHKIRAQWFQSRAAWPAREAPIARLIREREVSSKALAPAAGVAQWELAGPTNIGGRMTSLVCNPAQPDPDLDRVRRRRRVVQPRRRPELDAPVARTRTY